MCKICIYCCVIICPLQYMCEVIYTSMVHPSGLCTWCWLVNIFTWGWTCRLVSYSYTAIPITDAITSLHGFDGGVIQVWEVHDLLDILDKAFCKCVSNEAHIFGLSFLFCFQQFCEVRALQYFFNTIKDSVPAIEASAKAFIWLVIVFKKCHFNPFACTGKYCTCGKNTIRYLNHTCKLTL